MQELEFRKWLNENGISKKMQSDYISRLKRLETKLEFFDIDEEYKTDKCQKLLKYLTDGCKDSPYSRELILLGTSRQYTVLKHTVKKYITFLESIIN